MFLISHFKGNVDVVPLVPWLLLFKMLPLKLPLIIYVHVTHMFIAGGWHEITRTVPLRKVRPCKHLKSGILKKKKIRTFLIHIQDWRGGRWNEKNTTQHSFEEIIFRIKNIFIILFNVFFLEISKKKMCIKILHHQVGKI